jgi:hypothetical protein
MVLAGIGQSWLELVMVETDQDHISSLGSISNDIRDQNLVPDR